jgi:hypothetical protein
MTRFNENEAIYYDMTSEIINILSVDVTKTILL